MRFQIQNYTDTKMIKSKYLVLFILITISGYLFGQNNIITTYMNPVIPGDHPDPTLTRIGNDFYTTDHRSVRHRLFTIRLIWFIGKRLPNR